MRQSYIYQDFRFQRGSFVFPKDGLRPAVFCNFWSRRRLVADACNELGRSEAQFPGCLGYESDLFLGGLYPDPNREPPPELQRPSSPWIQGAVAHWAGGGGWQGI